MTDEDFDDADQKDNPKLQCSFEVSRKVRNFLRQLRPQLQEEFDLTEPDVEAAIGPGALRAAVSWMAKVSDMSKDKQRELVGEVGLFIQDYLDESEEDDE